MAGRLHRKYTEELLREAVRESTSVSGVLRFLGLPQAGGTHAHISRTIKRFGIDTSHFVRNRNGSHQRRKGPDVILVRIPFGSPRTKPHLLRRALLERGRPYSCALCGVDGTWQGAFLNLDIDHIDGDFHNNNEANLRFLCPNCHSQTANFAGRSKGSYGVMTLHYPPVSPREVTTS
ncbi:MAG: HNH endonuclease [Marmoricola sp.]|nr:HNH endonuclease [Marmoricola sp.]